MAVYSNGKRKSHSQAFTLIELLVVIAIIALLMAIWVPALSMAKKQTRAVVCASGMRQICLAFNTYGMENNEDIPIAYRVMANDIGSKPWTWALLPYIGGDEGKESTLEEPADLWFCPADKDPYPMGFSPHGQRYTSYALNGYYKKASAGSGWVAGRPELRFGPGGKYRLSQIKQPSGCMLMMETSYYGQVYDMMNPNLLRYTPDWQGHHRYTSGFYHNKAMNLMYVDGHISKIKGRDAEKVDMPVEIEREAHMFWPELSLPDSSENKTLWGPGY